MGLGMGPAIGIGMTNATVQAAREAYIASCAYVDALLYDASCPAEELQAAQTAALLAHDAYKRAQGLVLVAGLWVRKAL